MNYLSDFEILLKRTPQFYRGLCLEVSIVGNSYTSASRRFGLGSFAMKRRYHMTAHTVGNTESLTDGLLTPSKNHFKEASLSKEAAAVIKSQGLVRVAGNCFINKSTKDFWKVKGNKVVRVTVEEVDNGERISGPDSRHPQEFLSEILNDLEF
jgi:hypothetical protein